jgi:hypothetical protein
MLRLSLLCIFALLTLGTSEVETRGHEILRRFGLTNKNANANADCAYGPWSNWGSCSAAGTKVQTRQITTQPCGTGKNCTVVGPSSRTVPCGQSNVDCAYGPWCAWSACPVTCGSGVKTRTRQVQTPAKGNGKTCAQVGPSIDSKDGCRNNPPCVTVQPVDCAYGPWSAWCGCSVTCGAGTKTRTRQVQTQPAHGGKSCAQVGPSTQAQACNKGACGVSNVDCAYGPWSAWGACPVTCGSGTKTRTRQVQTPAKGNGKTCDQVGPSIDSKVGCRDMPACGTVSPVNCVWGPWSSWGQCSSTCGSGTQTQKRSIAVQASYGGAPCQGPSIQTVACANLPACVTPVNCVYGPWHVDLLRYLWLWHSDSHSNCDNSGC